MLEIYFALFSLVSTLYFNQVTQDDYFCSLDLPADIQEFSADDKQDYTSVVILYHVMIDSTGQSPCWVKLAAERDLQIALPFIKWTFMNEILALQSSPYIWEGPDYSDPENLLYDGQYPYQLFYLSILQKLSKSSLKETLALNPLEIEVLKRLGAECSIETPAACTALWLFRKLNET